LYQRWPAQLAILCLTPFLPINLQNCIRAFRISVLPICINHYSKKSYIAFEIYILKIWYSRL
jgi:hypothetical protein